MSNGIPQDAEQKPVGGKVKGGSGFVLFAILIVSAIYMYANGPIQEVPDASQKKHQVDVHLRGSTPATENETTQKGDGPASEQSATTTSGNETEQNKK